MKSPCAVLALLPLLLFASTIESRNQPGAYWGTPTNDQPINLKPSPSSPSHGRIIHRPIPSGPGYGKPTNLKPSPSSPSHEPIIYRSIPSGPVYGQPKNLKPSPSSPSHGPIIHKPIPSGPGYGLIRSGQSDNKEPQVILEYFGKRDKSSPITHNEGFKTPKSSAKDLDATQTFTMIFGEAFKHINSPAARDSRLTPDVNNVAIIHFLENLKRVSVSPVKPTPCIQTINVDVKTPKKSPYNNNITPAFVATYSVKATPDVATTSIDRETLMKLFRNKSRATPYASHYSSDDVVPNGKSPPAQPSPRNIINWI